MATSTKPSFAAVPSPSRGRPELTLPPIRLALQTAKAIDTLHSSTPPVIHRDIKSANVLIDRNYNARLGDFGLALRGHEDDYRLRSTPPAVDWAIPLIKKGKLLCVYDPRISPPKDPLVRKQLAVIAAKCVRSCRERRPSMKEIVAWLTGLCKLVPLHSWNGFNNPCMMIETVGRPVEARSSNAAAAANSSPNRGGGGNFDEFDGNARLSKSASRFSRRVYSDLGFSRNLMDLMASTEEPEFLREEAKSAYHVSSSSRFGSGRYFTRGLNLYRACGTEKDALGLSHEGQIVGDGDRSNLCSKPEEGVSGGSDLNSQEVEAN
ncbi:serine/threonine-protein kinase-like protein [Senna tora]|uniref:Serine/threonine-protein kinase-like protein n=1 Tax=Senna tora TaxID=362788 RepID=A0A834WKU8_9FABA|nr:serine/threonine-protein kinase-like protein [Senna tora]